MKFNENAVLSFCGALTGEISDGFARASQLEDGFARASLVEDGFARAANI